ncbi:MAG: hypothetical protein QOH06_1254 [Acidobacteriota bacterium]|jgi:uncharacterized protein (DUF58 family)|nr:hypothetical protein [Acidobacteriota bacterium]
MNAVRFLSALLLLLAACTVPSGPAGSAASGGEAPFQFRLAVRETYSAGEPVTIGFFLENLSAEPLRILTWYTPLEGIKGSIFRVTRDGQEVPYQGPMVKRGDPGQGDYVLVPPGAPVSAEVDLARGWDLSVPGTYRVDFEGRIHDVAKEGESVPRPRDAHQGKDAKGEPVTFRVVP